MLAALTRFFVAFFRRWMPDPFPLALLLTVVVLVAAALFGTADAAGMLRAWYRGFVGIFPFTIEMALILVAGHALASSPPVRRALRWIAALPRSEVAAILTVFFGTAIAAWLNWGFGLVVGGLLAVQVGRRSSVDAAFLVAVSYSSFVIWHSGLSGSIPVVLATAGHKYNFLATPAHPVTPLGETIFGVPNLVVIAAILVLVPLVLLRVRPRAAERRPFDSSAEVGTDEVPARPAHPTPAQRQDHSVITTVALVLLALGYLVARIYERGLSLDLHLIIFLFLFGGLALHRRPVAYGQAFASGVRIAAPILLQYPFYGGIMGLVTGTGLAAAISKALVAWSGPTTLPLFGFLSAGVLNVVVPSGGGQWAVQGPVMLQAAADVGASPVGMAMAVVWGDQWTNMIQPFWALPILALAGREARDIMGYCVVTLLVSGLIFGAATFLL